MVGDDYRAAAGAKLGWAKAFAYSLASFTRFKALKCFFCNIDSASDSIPAASVRRKELLHPGDLFFGGSWKVRGREPALRGNGSSAPDLACRQSRAGISFRSGK